MEVCILVKWLFCLVGTWELGPYDLFIVGPTINTHKITKYTNFIVVFNCVNGKKKTSIQVYKSIQWVVTVMPFLKY